MVQMEEETCQKGVLPSKKNNKKETNKAGSKENTNLLGIKLYPLSYAVKLMINIVGTCLNRQRDQYTKTGSLEIELKIWKFIAISKS